MSATPKPKVTVVLANLGTPDQATVPAVRRFLKQFLSDTRVIEIPKPIWWIILHLFVLTFRPKRVAEAYASVWSKDSPMREIVLEQTELVKQRLQSENQPFDLTVVPAMTYGQPSIYTVFEQLEKDPQELHDCALLPAYKMKLTEMRNEMVVHLSERGDGFVKDNQLVRRDKTLLYSPNYPKE